MLSTWSLNTFAATKDEAAPVAAEVDEAAEGATSGKTGDCNWSYNTSSGELKITGSGKMADYNYGSDAPWESYLESAKSVIIESGVTYVGDNSFSNTNATKITIADTVTEIGDSAFSGTYKASSCKLSANLTKIGDDAFYGLGVTALTIPKELTEIGNYAFMNCSNLRFLVIPDECACEFGWYTFYNCKALENISIGKNAVISENCFANCISVQRYQVSTEHPTLTAGGGHLFSKDKTKLYYYCNGNGATSSEFSSNIKEIGDYALSGNTTLTTITLPAGLKKIGRHSFQSSMLTNLTFRGTDLQEVGADAFYDTPWLNKQPAGLLYVSSVAYRYKGDAPKSITLKSGTKGIGNNCFKGQMTLENITLPSSLLHIGEAAFRGCENLTGMELPDSLQSIGAQAFYNCTSVTKMLLPDSVTEIGEQCFYCCKSMTEFRLSSKITTLPTGALEVCSSLKGNFDVPASVSRIGGYVFRATGINTVTIWNRNAEFYDSYVLGVTTLRGYHGSTTQKHAETHSSYFHFKPIDIWISGKLTTYLSDSDKVKLRLVDITTATTADSITATGTDYIIPYVKTGYYYLEVSKKNHVTREYDYVWVKDDDFVQDIELNPIGDISGDGKVTAKDYAMANAHVQKIDTLTDYPLKCGDVLKGDGKITAADAARINAHVQKIDTLW